MFTMGPMQTEWIDILPKFNQTNGNLKDENGYCCLGVACEVLGPRIGVTLREFRDFIEGVDGDDDYEDVYFKAFTEDDNSQELLPGDIWKSLGLRSPVGNINYEECPEAVDYFGDNDQELSLADMNDNGYTFIEIQEFVRRYPRAVFTRSV